MPQPRTCLKPKCEIFWTLPQNRPQNAKNGLKMAVFRVGRGWGGEKSGFCSPAGLAGLEITGLLISRENSLLRLRFFVPFLRVVHMKCLIIHVEEWAKTLSWF